MSPILRNMSLALAFWIGCRIYDAIRYGFTSKWPERPTQFEVLCQLLVVAWVLTPR